MKADECLLKRTVLPCTLHETERIQCEYVLTAWKKFFADRFTRFSDEHVASNLDPVLVKNLASTHFGLHLSKRAPANEKKPRIRNFIKYLAAENRNFTSVINIFNTLCDRAINYECGEPLVADEMIEYKTKKLKVQREMSEDDIKLYSLWTDLTPGELEGLLTRFGKNTLASTSPQRLM